MTVDRLRMFDLVFLCKCFAVKKYTYGIYLIWSKLFINLYVLVVGLIHDDAGSGAESPDRYNTRLYIVQLYCR